MASWKGKSRGGVIGYKIFFSILKYSKLSFVYFVLRFVVVYFIFFSPKVIKSLILFYKKILNFSLFSTWIHIFKNYFIFGQTIIDKLVLFAGIRNEITFDFDGEEYLHQMVKQKKGGILLSGHIGNWDLAAHLLKRINTKINVIILDAEHKKIKNYISEVKENANVNFIPIKNDMSHIYKLNKVLVNKEIVSIHGDRFTQGAKTEKIPFLGRKAEFPIGPFQLAQKYQVPISFVFAMKESTKHYHFYATLPVIIKKERSGQKRKKEVNKHLNDFIFLLEKMVKKYPEQWFNYYDFWGLKIEK